MDDEIQTPEAPWRDPIVDEVRAIRREIDVEFGHDVHAYFEHLRKVQEQYRDRLVSRVGRAPEVGGAPAAP